MLASAIISRSQHNLRKKEVHFILLLMKFYCFGGIISSWLSEFSSFESSTIASNCTGRIEDNEVWFINGWSISICWMLSSSTDCFSFESILTIHELGVVYWSIDSFVKLIFDNTHGWLEFSFIVGNCFVCICPFCCKLNLQKVGWMRSTGKEFLSIDENSLLCRLSPIVFFRFFIMFKSGETTSPRPSMSTGTHNRQRK